MMRSMLYLLIAAVVAAALIALVNDSTRLQRDRNQAEYAARLLREVLPPGEYDQAPGLEVINVAGGTVALYPARRDGKIAAAALRTVAPDGYVGPIALLIGVTPDGLVTGVRAAGHRETPGLGDRIDIDKSDWVEQYRGRQLQPARQWALRADGGDIDQISGATITSRAVTNAVRNALEQYAAGEAELVPAGTD